MNKRTIIVFTLLLMTAILNVTAQTTTIKIGYCDPNYIYYYLPELKQIESELLVYEKQLQATLDSKGQELEKKIAEYKNIASDPNVPVSIKTDKENEIRSLEQSIQAFQEKAGEDFQNKQLALMEPVHKKVQDAINKVGAANGFTYIFNITADASGSPIILYAKNESDNISDLVLKELGVTPPVKTTTGTGTTGTTGTTKTGTTGTTGTGTTTPKTLAPVKTN